MPELDSTQYQTPITPSGCGSFGVGRYSELYWAYHSRRYLLSVVGSLVCHRGYSIRNLRRAVGPAFRRESELDIDYRDELPHHHLGERDPPRSVGRRRTILQYI